MGRDTWEVGRGCCFDVGGDDPSPLEPFKILKAVFLSQLYVHSKSFNLDILNIDQHCFFSP